jgi:hypothetical protein
VVNNTAVKDVFEGCKGDAEEFTPIIPGDVKDGPETQAHEFR